VFLHEHAHTFGYDGQRGFTDALTELLETVARQRSVLDVYEREWDAARQEVERERQQGREEVSHAQRHKGRRQPAREKRF